MSPPSQRRRGQDSSAGELMPMPNSPATDGLSPAPPQDTSLFSSPRPSGLNHTTPTDWITLNYFLLQCLYVPSKSRGLFCLFFSPLFFSVLPNEVDMSSPLIYGTPSSRVEGTPRSGVRGTPARQRPDLGSVRKAPQVDLHSEPVSGGFNSILTIIQT